ncbi:MAG: methyltransferase domain-containing protein [Nitrososphaerales archaeon]
MRAGVPFLRLRRILHEGFGHGIRPLRPPQSRGCEPVEGGRKREDHGFADRIQFLKGHIFDSDFAGEDFDLFVSNLVFHNLGERRFAAYERLASWARPGSYTLLGDRFSTYRKDLKRLSTLFGTVREVPGVSVWHVPYRLLVMQR